MKLSQDDTYYAFILNRKNKKNVLKQAVFPQNYKVMKLSFYNHSKNEIKKFSCMLGFIITSIAFY